MSIDWKREKYKHAVYEEVRLDRREHGKDNRQERASTADYELHKHNTFLRALTELAESSRF